ncbi:MAG: histidine phosphatase family protein [Candidatus Micrarchaeota archaeon]
MKQTVYLVRHAKFVNPHHLYYGRLPGFPLSKIGQKQATWLAKRFATKGIQAVFASPLLRTRQTGGKIAKAAKVPLFFDRLLIERNLAVQGKTQAQVRELKKQGVEIWLETPEEVAVRMKRFLRKALGRKLETIVAVSHQDPISFLVRSLERKTLDGSFFQPERAAVTKLVFENKRLKKSEYYPPHGFK